jgi:hypothetical protein
MRHVRDLEFLTCLGMWTVEYGGNFPEVVL